jgi:hypothetical protein
MHRWHWRRFLHLVLAGSVAASALACGCSSNTPTWSIDPSKTHLTGKITYHGKPFPGYILVQSEDNRHTEKAVFTREGYYLVTDVPTGKVKLGLLPPPHPRRRLATNRQAPEIKTPEVIPTQYNDPSKSGLTVEIHPGRNEYSVDLP